MAESVRVGTHDARPWRILGIPHGIAHGPPGHAVGFLGPLGDRRAGDGFGGQNAHAVDLAAIGQHGVDARHGARLAETAEGWNARRAKFRAVLDVGIHGFGVGSPGP